MWRYCWLLFLSVVFTWGFNVDSARVGEGNSSVVFSVKEEISKDLLGSFTHKELIKCTPKIDGVFEYTNTQTITQYPAKPLIAGINYSCNTKEGKVEFASYDFIINSFTMVAPDKFRLQFSDDVDIDKLKSTLKLLSDSKLINYQISTQNRGIFIIKTPLKPTNLTIKIDGFLKSKNGAVLGDNYEAKLNLNQPKFEDIKTAKTLSDFELRAAAFDDGTLGFRVFVPSWIDVDTKFVQIDGIKNISKRANGYASNVDQNERIGVDTQINYAYLEFSSNELKPNTDYTVRFYPGFGNSYSMVRDEIKINFKTGDLKPFLTFTDTKPYISKNASISFKSANSPKIQVIVEKLLDQNYRYFLNFNNQDDAQNLTSEIINKSFELDGVKNSISEHKIALDMDKFDDGVYKVSVYYDKQNSQSKIVYLSDLGISAKVGSDGVFVYVNNLSDTKDVDGAKVTLYSSNNTIIAEGKTDDGVFMKDIPNLASKSPTSISVEDGKQKSFLILNQPLNSSLLESKFAPTKLALIYLASDIIRPGEPLIGSVIFKNNDYESISNLPVKLRLRAPDGKIIKNIITKTDDFGVVKIDENLTTNATGRYEIEAILEDKILDRKSFSQEYFVPHRVKNEISLSKTSYIADEPIEISLNSRYLFGAPAANLQGSATLHLHAFKKDLKGYEGYSFADENIEDTNYLTSQTKDFLLDENGEKNMLFLSNIPQNAPQIIKAGVSFDVLDGSKTVSAYKLFDIYTNPVIIGIKAGSNYIDENQEVKFSLATLKVADFSEQNQSVDVKIYHKTWEYSLNTNAEYRWEKSQKLVKDLGEITSSFTHKFSQSGEFIIVASNLSTGASASVGVYVSGWDYTASMPSQEISQAAIKLDKTSYLPGESINISASSAIQEGFAIVSLNDTKVRDYKIVNFKNGVIKTALKAPDNFKGADISVSVFRSVYPNPQPLRTYGQVHINLDNSQKSLPLSIQKPASASSNEKLNIKVKTTPNTKVVFFAVDEGALRVIKQPLLDAHKFFDRAYPTNVVEYDLYDLVSSYSSKAKALEFGSDFMLAAAAMEKYESPVREKNVKTFKIMQLATTDTNGEANFELTTPNAFNSSLRLTAIALTKDKISSQNVMLDVKDDIVIKPSTVLYLLEGDEVKIPLTLINTTNLTQNFAIAISSSENLRADLNESKFSLKPLKSSQATITLKAIKSGASYFSVKSVKDGANYVNISELDIISPYNVYTYAKSGYATNDLTLNVPSQSYSSQLDISYSPLAMALKQSNYLVSYPHGCTEQKSSQIIALLQLLDSSSGSQKEDILRFIKFGAHDIISRLKNDGSFGYWNQEGYVNQNSSIYAADVLLGSDLTKEILGKANAAKILNYLSKGEFDSDSDKVYAAFVLMREGKLERAGVNFLFDNKIYVKNLSTYYMMAAILKHSNLNQELKDVLDEISRQNIIKTDISDLANALFVHSLYFKPDSFSDSMAKHLSANLDELYSTHSRALALRALKNYYPDVKEFDFSVNVDTNITSYTKPVKLNFKQISNLSISPKKPLYYSLVSYGRIKPPLNHVDVFSKKLPNTSFNTKLYIYRTFVDENAKEIDLNSLKLNQKIYSKVTVNNYFKTLLVNEPISSCFEIVNERIYGNTRAANIVDSAKFENQEITDYSVTNFLEAGGGIVTYYTPLKVVMRGNCKLPSINAELMNNESINAYDLATYEFEVK